VAGLAKLKMNEAQRKTVVSTVTVYGKTVYCLGFFLESSKVTGSTCSCASQRKRPEHLVYWLPAFKKKSSQAMGVSGVGIKNITTLKLFPQPPLYMSRFRNTGMREREAAW